MRAKPGPRLNRRKYVELLAEALPTVITSEEEYSRMIAIVDRLAVRREPSVEEERLLELLSTLIEVYENEKYPIPDAPPHVMIQQFMLDRGLRQADLVPVLGSRSLVSEVVNGKRRPSKMQVKNLGRFFGVSPELFISLD
ncbi:MAG TPA: helix-turn-helix domain-containing protein [Blastocatellia bacterium]|nr:helix-turn-helix domain-containing protein [Blastocatellia bacterium]